MTSKKRRQRGSRTHGGGSQKNRRGAGNRGGRGAAGRAKHEKQNHPPLGKSGFNRPDKIKEKSKVINVQKLDEDADLFVAEGIAEQRDSTYLIDARNVVEDGFENVVKVLGSGQVQRELVVVADEFSSPAIEKIESAGGNVLLPDESPPDRLGEVEQEVTIEEDNEVVIGSLGGDLKNCNKSNNSMNNPNSGYIREKREEVEDGKQLDHDEANTILEKGYEEDRLDEAYEVIVKGYQNRRKLSTDDVVELYRLHSAVQDLGIHTKEIDNVLDEYFGEMMEPKRLEQIQRGAEEHVTLQDVEAELKRLEEDWQELVDSSTYRPDENGLEQEKKKYLLSVRDNIQ